MPCVARALPSPWTCIMRCVSMPHSYRIHMLYLRLASPKLALRRIAARFKQEGHKVEPHDVLRRFDPGRKNFTTVYRLGWTGCPPLGYGAVGAGAEVLQRDLRVR